MPGTTTMIGRVSRPPSGTTRRKLTPHSHGATHHPEGVPRPGSGSCLGALNTVANIDIPFLLTITGREFGKPLPQGQLHVVA